MKNKSFTIAVFIITLIGYAQQVTTVAGSNPGYLDWPGIQAQFSDPMGLCIDASGNIYVADRSNNRIRKIEATGNHMVSTVAGSGVEGYADGIGVNAVFAAPNGICIDQQGNLYVTDFWNYKIRKITPAGVVTTVVGTTQGYADGSASIAKFGYLGAICIDSLGNLFVADGGNNRIRKITPNGIVFTVAGSVEGYLDGIGPVARFSYPVGICIDNFNNLYVTEFFNQTIRKIDSLGMVSTVAGSTWGYADGQGTDAQFKYPSGVCADTYGNLFITDSNNHRIRKISPSGWVSTYTGSVFGYVDGTLSEALFKSPWAICNGFNGDLYIAEIDGDKIRKIETSLSLNENQINNRYTLSPNPNNGNFTIASDEAVKVEIFDNCGRQVFYNNNVLHNVSTDLSKGIYLVRISNSKNEVCNEKIIIE
ncbi:T9SS type A sorting domain-containing protein [Flavobacterium sp. SUN046]|uniref:T9SS type A sorting domain-containing protein n=1 Tax=Flavobacterium sp. SUN046 TaxID=3002440 RepID=UPI002DBE3604|nr:T9SS type A sorting domain-containing protein [Flavobacterium sp. SUN046]MEC4048429.1 T9SS type A sorting domain-containing protein [Flavobacterium sp. SUN046]